MVFAVVHACGLDGIEAFPVRVEVDMATGQLPGWQMVGLAESAVKESKERVLTALRNAGYPVPAQKVTVNLSPASMRKEGTCFDLPIALGLLACQGHVAAAALGDAVFSGELSLDAQIKKVPGVLASALCAKRQGFKRFFVASENIGEAAVVNELETYALAHLSEFLLHAREPRLVPHVAAVCDRVPDYSRYGDFAEVRGQYHAKRALEIAAAGAHNVLLVGPPGTGKSLLCQRLPTILPLLSFDEAVETTKIYSRMGLVPPGRGLFSERPFRAPHHSVSDAGLMGGGSTPRPGEISLAHNGVLFLDELPEFKRHILELLRQPLEEGRATITRARKSVEFPARFLLAAAMNPCPCGYLGHASRPCTCTPNQIKRYQSRLSGPLLDRIDLYIELAALKPEELIATSRPAESSLSVRERVARSRTLQAARFSGEGVRVNAHMRLPQVQRFCTLAPAVKKTVFSLLKEDRLSARGYHRMLKVARTVADLAGRDTIGVEHVLEAYQYRYKTP